MLFHFYHSFLNLQLFPWDDQCTKLASHFVIFVNAADPLLFQYLISCWLWISPSAFKLVKFSTVLFRLLIKMKYLTFKCALCYTSSQSTSLFCVYIQAYTHLHIWTYTHVYLFLRYRVCITDSYSQLKRKCLFHCYCRSATQSCLTFCDPMDCSRPHLPVLHHLPQLAQTHVHWVSDAIQSSCALSSPSPPAFNLSQHHGLF